MEDYIFIIIAIVLSAIGAINKNKKKKLAQMGNEEATRPRPSVFDQFFDDPVFEAPKPEPIVEKPKKVEPKIKPLKKPAMQTPFQQSTVGIPRKKIKTSFSEEEEIVEKTRESVMDGFSLKKAFIYSEILQRKY